MGTDDERCDEAKRLLRIGAAFEQGDLDALREAVDDPSVVPHGPMPAAIGSCLVYAIYHSPLAFIAALLELGADPNGPTDTGFPPLIAALSCSGHVPGAIRRTDVDEIVRLLLAFGADPNQRGINDYTALHMAVAQRQALAVQLLLEAGADPALRTRIDGCETPLEMARAAGYVEIAAILEQEGRPRKTRLRAGVTLLADVRGAGDRVRRQHRYRLRLRFALNGGQAVRWPRPWGPVGAARLIDEGETLITEVRMDRGSLINGLFYGMEGMHVGGTRRLQISPHLAYRERGVPGLIPPNAVLVVEVSVLAAL